MPKFQPNTNQLASLASFAVLEVWFPEKKPSPTTSLSIVIQEYPSPSDHQKFSAFCKYVQRKIKTSVSVVVLALLFCSRLKQKIIEKKGFHNPLPQSERALWIVCLLLANKILDDDRFSNLSWSKVAGISIQEMNKVERECLGLLDFYLFVSEHDYSFWLQKLEQIFNNAIEKLRTQQQEILTQSPCLNFTNFQIISPPVYSPNSPQFFPPIYNNNQQLLFYETTMTTTPGMSRVKRAWKEQIELEETTEQQSKLKVVTDYWNFFDLNGGTTPIGSFSNHGVVKNDDVSSLAPYYEPLLFKFY